MKIRMQGSRILKFITEKNVNLVTKFKWLRLVLCEISFDVNFNDFLTNMIDFSCVFDNLFLQYVIIYPSGKRHTVSTLKSFNVYYFTLLWSRFLEFIMKVTILLIYLNLWIWILKLSEFCTSLFSCVYCLYVYLNFIQEL